MLNKIEVAAIEKFALSVTIPILLDRPNNGVGLQGSGTLFKVGEQHLIVTARHNFDGVNLETLAYPTAPLGGDTHTLGKISLFMPKDEHVDVAVIRLECPETIERLSKFWHFLSLKNIARPLVNAPEESFFVAGYPFGMTQVVKGQLQGGFVIAYSDRILVAPKWAEKPVVENLDLFFEYAKKAIKIGAGEIDSPKLPGVSGASVWQVGTSGDGVWTPESIVRVIGVQSSYKHSEYFRAKSWWAVAQVLEEIDESLAKSVREHLTL
jgi:hypothetical protein